MQVTAAIFWLLAIVLIVTGMAFDAAPHGTYNIGLLNLRSTLFEMGAAFLISGSVFAAAVCLLSRLSLALPAADRPEHKADVGLGETEFRSATAREKLQEYLRLHRWQTSEWQEDGAVTITNGPHRALVRNWDQVRAALEAADYADLRMS